MKVLGLLAFSCCFYVCLNSNEKQIFGFNVDGETANSSKTFWLVVYKPNNSQKDDQN